MRTLALSLLLTTVAVAQQLPKADPKVDGRNHQQVLDDLVKAQLTAEKPPAKGSVEEAILNAQRNHPDIKLAEAKRQMADAEVEQAKFLVAQRVATAFGKVEQAKASLAPAEEYFVAMKQAGTKIEAMNANAQYQRLKTELMAAELELKAATGAAARPVAARGMEPGHDAQVGVALKWLTRSQLGEAVTAPPGSPADRLKGLIDKPVQLELKAADLDEAVAAVLKAAGEPSLTAKLPTLGKKYLKNPPTATVSGVMSVTAAFQFVMDEMNGQQAGLTDPQKGRYDVYVREYGLLIARADEAPKDALTLTEFARQVRAAKGEKK